MATLYSHDESRIIEIYVEIGIPSDALSSADLVEFARRLKGKHDLEELRKAIIRIRKGGRLTRLTKSGHGPAKVAAAGMERGKDEFELSGVHRQ